MTLSVFDLVFWGASLPLPSMRLSNLLRGEPQKHKPLGQVMLDHTAPDAFVVGHCMLAHSHGLGVLKLAGLGFSLLITFCLF